MQDEWKIRANLTLNAGLRWEPYLPIKNSLGYGSNFDKARFDQGIRSRSIRRRPPDCIFPGDDGFPGNAVMNSKLAQFAPRVGVVWTPDEDTAFRGGLGHVLRHAAPLLQHAIRQQSAVGRADHAHESGGRLRRSVSRPIPGGNPFPALATGWQTQPFPAFGVYVNAPLDTQPTSLQQWNLGAQRQVGDWLLSGELPRQPLDPPVARDRAQPGRLLAGGDDGQRRTSAACCSARTR